MTSNTGNWVTTFRKEAGSGSRKHLEVPLLILSLSNKAPDLPQGPKCQNDWQMPLGYFLAPEKVTDSFIHFQSLNSGVRS